MAKYLSKKHSLRHQAMQVYLVLIACAINRQIKTYKDIAGVLGFRGAGVLNRQLGHIMFWCDQNKLPPLTALVVNAKAGTPGRGLITPRNLDADRERVFKKKWFQIQPPTADELDVAYRKGMAGLRRKKRR